LVKRVEKFLILYPQLGKGKIESIVLAMDKQAKKVCEANLVNFLDLEEILRALKIKGALRVNELKELIETIEREDKTKIKAKGKILSE